MSAFESSRPVFERLRLLADHGAVGDVLVIDPVEAVEILLRVDVPASGDGGDGAWWMLGWRDQLRVVLVLCLFAVIAAIGVSVVFHAVIRFILSVVLAGGQP